MRNKKLISAIVFMLCASGYGSVSNPNSYSAGGPTSIHVIAPTQTMSRQVELAVIGDDGHEFKNFQVSTKDNNVTILPNGILEFEKPGIYEVTVTVLSFSDSIKIAVGNITDAKVVKLESNEDFNILVETETGESKLYRDSFPTDGAVKVSLVKDNKIATVMTRSGNFLESKILKVEGDRLVVDSVLESK